jgi:hypothetical protein
MRAVDHIAAASRCATNFVMKIRDPTAGSKQISNFKGQMVETA